MTDMHKIFLDGDDFSTYDQFLEVMSQKIFVDTNSTLSGLDALEDSMEGGFGIFELDVPIILKWKNFRKSMEDLSYGETEKYYLRMLDNCHPSNRDEVKTLLNLAKQHIGQTLFFMILEVFFDTENLSIELY